MGKGREMPIAFMFAALISGAVCAMVWLSLGGAAVGAFVIYALSGNMMLAALVANTAVRSLR